MKRNLIKTLQISARVGSIGRFFNNFDKKIYYEISLNYFHNSGRKENFIKSFIEFWRHIILYIKTMKNNYF